MRQFRVRWSLTSLTQWLNVLSNAIELCKALRDTNANWQPVIESSDGLFSEEELAEIKAAGL